MSSYNLINGSHTSVSYELLTEMLRNEWGFQGHGHDRLGVHSNHSDEVLAGNNVKMGDGEPEELKAAFENGKITRRRPRDKRQAHTRADDEGRGINQI